MAIKSIILAAGKGTRMKSDKPKVLHEIFDKTLLGYVLDAVNGTGKVDESFVIVGHQAEVVDEYVKSNYENAKTILQTPQLGTGHAVSMACPELEDFDGEVIILCGDTPLITSNTLEAFIKSHKNNFAHITVMTANFDNPKNYGRIIRNIDGSVKAIVEEKDATEKEKQIQEVNAGIYCLNWQKVKKAFSELKSNNAQGEYYLTDIIAWGTKKNLNVQAYTLKDNNEILGINSKIQLAEASKILNNRSLKRLMNDGITIIDPENTWISPETNIDTDTIIYPNTFITGKNEIGKNCKIGPFSHIRGGCKIGNNVRIGNFVEIKKSEIKDNTNVSHLSYIGDSELGSHVNIGAGTITANYNPITKVKSKTVIKDNANTGSNSVLVAPLTVEEGGFVAAGTTVTKDVEEKSLAISRAELRTIKNYVK
ncbi:bifunctional N-acetylglucosamine-1-phosphate uridyltransferase/glucosamine-1-phosphate acetyltransferase [bacterium]|nr:bifunctional N-acetylglucosamine-1-phosphate uridyltransferase/glucosamine-1-phosphate acetyltransferase [bacterium]